MVSPGREVDGGALCPLSRFVDAPIIFPRLRGFSGGDDIGDGDCRGLAVEPPILSSCCGDHHLLQSSVTASLISKHQSIVPKASAMPPSSPHIWKGLPPTIWEKIGGGEVQGNHASIFDRGGGRVLG